jgi:hypothetical protein
MVKNLNRVFLSVVLIFIMSLSLFSQTGKEADIKRLWIDCKLTGEIPFEVFNTAILGLHKLEGIKNKNIISIIDYSKPSTEKRFYLIDLDNKQLLYRCFVAHGKNTGENKAENFSNISGSLKSSLGFYLTGETYSGDNGYSLKLDGLEKGINDNARAREIVIHGAAYVSQDFIDKYGRLGRSWGCPALPSENSKDIIDKISGGSCLFIFARDNFYRENSIYYKPDR